MVSSYLPLFCCSLAILLGLALVSGSGLQKNVTAKRWIPTKPTVDELAIELAKKHLLKLIVDEQHVFDKAKESLYILQRDSCTNIKSVGTPVTHNTRYYVYGVWMKDPLGIMGLETVFSMDNYYGNVLHEFANMDMFKAGVARKKYRLPSYGDGTGAVVYGPYLYYNIASTYYIAKYNLKTQREEAKIIVGSYRPRKNYYQSGGYSGIDLAVDEQGLWVLWGSTYNNYRLYASKIDLTLNRITNTWSLNTERMSAMGNAFVACGVIYTIDSYSGKTTINFAYDTKTSKQWNPNIKFTNQYNCNTMVDYNPREKVLYAWDNRRQVTYSITFEEQ